MAPPHTLTAGIDVGSTTAKLVLCSEDSLRIGEPIFSRYQRHNADIGGTVTAMVREARQALGNAPAACLVTGTAGMGLAERTGLPFRQELVAASWHIHAHYPLVRTLVDLGGEDAKLVFYDRQHRVDMRMNGNCAGGTGAFIDQMASLLDTTPAGLDQLAADARHVYPIASRCGVFAKTDVQNLVSRQVSPSDIAASVFRAVALQTVSSLARGRDMQPAVAFSGGPLTFLASLGKAFREVLGLAEADVASLRHPELLPALGAAGIRDAQRVTLPLADLEMLLARKPAPSRRSPALSPLFSSPQDRGAWLERKRSIRVGRVELAELDGSTCFLGIDSGSTTTKIVLADARGRIGLEHYAPNNGDPIGAVSAGLSRLRALAESTRVRIELGRVAVTGYGEDLIRAVFRADDGVVETIAHQRAARAFCPSVTFVLDIGGQDMKAIHVDRGAVTSIEINEACSSGCGSFIETFARSLGHSASDFARMACEAGSPADLGTRCTVFMNSRVKQSLREGATVPDIAAGLAVSVIRNCFTKVLKIHDGASLGPNVVVQGGTFRNPAVLKAVEDFLGQEVIRPDVPELMGAYGAALLAQEAYYREGRPASGFVGWIPHNPEASFRRREFLCGGCENHCRITTLRFLDGRAFHVGNKCERHVANRGNEASRGTNLVAYKERLLFGRPTLPRETPRGRIGIPRALNTYDRFPFWCELLVESGFEVVLSSQSNTALAARAAPTVVSENLCFPAKLASAHVLDLLDRDVDRILFPMVKYEVSEHDGAVNTFTCPVVLGYPDVVRSTIDPQGRHGVPLDTPVVSFADLELLRRACVRYLGSLGVDRGVAAHAFSRALKAQADYRRNLRAAGARLLRSRRAGGPPAILLLGRPYHADPLVNQRIPEMIASFGLDVFPEDAIPYHRRPGLGNVHILTQWSYINRMLEAAQWAGERPDVEVLELNSFGCGPDALTYDEAREILATRNKNLTVIRVDEISSPGSNRLRIRSMVESLRSRPRASRLTAATRIRNRIFRRRDRAKTIIAPQFSPFFTLLLQSSFRSLGYTLEVLPEPDSKSVEVGLRYTNSDICYPATIVIGDIIKALQSGRYDPERTAVAISQTGGQCRASSYVALLKKALIAAGFPHVPVVSVSLGGISMNDQPGFRLSAPRLLLQGLFATVYTDALSALYTYTATRELIKGQALGALNLCLEDAGRRAIGRPWVMIRLLQIAMRRFRRIPIRRGPVPRVGIVGEIYLKYNPFGNGNIVEWLISRGVEPVVPPILSFFIKRFVNVRFNRDNFVERLGGLRALAYSSFERLVERVSSRANRILASFHSLHPFHPIRSTARRARRVLSLVNQYGECWLLPGEICMLAEHDVKHVVSLQPFGCIANHVLAKGMEKRLKELYPDLNLLYLDMDAGSSEVNTLNRLHFLVEGARRSRDAETEHPAAASRAERA